MEALSRYPKVAVEACCGRSSTTMRVGCGLEVRTVKGKRYLYFWKYNEAGGRSMRTWKYLGPAGSGETKRKALMELTASYDTARAELERRLRIIRTRLTVLR
jgi:hypothetical protein